MKSQMIRALKKQVFEGERMCRGEEDREIKQNME
jgi:hypothetical protein